MNKLLMAIVLVLAASWARAERVVMEGKASTGNSIFVSSIATTVGIGMTSPSAVLEVQGATAGFGQIVISTNSTARSNNIVEGLALETAAGSVVSGSSLGDFDIWGKGGIGFSANNGSSQQVKLLSNGNFGVGTPNPGTLVNVSSGVLTVDGSGGHANLKGDVSGNGAAIGFVGEIMSANSSAQTPGPTGTWVALSTITLTPGDWMVSGMGQLNTNTIVMTSFQVAISNTNTTPDGQTFNNVAGGAYAGNNTAVIQTPVGPRHVVVSVNTNYYILGVVNYSALNSAVWSTASIIQAVRIR